MSTFKGFRGCFDTGLDATQRQAIPVVKPSLPPAELVDAEEFRIVVAWRGYRDALAAYDRRVQPGNRPADVKRELHEKVKLAWEILLAVTTPPGLEVAEMHWQGEEDQRQEREELRAEAEAAERAAGWDPNP